MAAVIVIAAVSPAQAAGSPSNSGPACAIAGFPAQSEFFLAHAPADIRGGAASVIVCLMGARDDASDGPFVGVASERVNRP
jgi:hypothetical protein